MTTEADSLPDAKEPQQGEFVEEIVETEEINEETYKDIISEPYADNELLSFSGFAQLEQVKLLRSINSKLTFFAAVLVLYLLFFILSLLGGFFLR